MHEILGLLPKPSRYTGGEEGAVHKKPEHCRLRVGLAFPDMYEVGMSYLGQKILYALVNEREHWWAERVFTPCREAGDILRTRKVPLSTLEGDTPLASLDVLGLSLTHELCYTNVLYMLDLAGIPLRAEHRCNPNAQGKPWPLVVAGGGCTLAAEPLAPFVDLMLLGEGEEVFIELLELVEKAKTSGWSRQALLLAASHIAGVYVPEFFVQQGAGVRALHPHHTQVQRRLVLDMDQAAYPKQYPLPFGAVHNRLALEIGRGCTRGCRFCQAGTIYRPARERSVPTLQTLLDACLNSTGYEDVSFLSLSTGDFSALKQLFMSTVDRCTAEQVSVSLPSLRVGSIDDAIMERMAGIRRTGATLAPEAGSQRLRDVINKGISEHELILHIQKLFEHGWRQVKLYFMIGLPTETDDDLLAIVDLCRKARDAAGPGIKSMQITAAISPFVPKPHTPFQWEAQIPLEEIRRRIGVLLAAFRKEKRITMRWHEAEMSTLEGIFSRGDRRLAPVVEAAYRKGAIFSSWMEGFSLAPWLEALAEQGLTVSDYTRARSLDETLPWEHLHSGVSTEYLLRERQKALDSATTTDCRYTHCHFCGVCDTKAGSSLLGPVAKGCANRLNAPERDQAAHTVTLDAYNRVVPKHTGGETAPPQSTGQKAKPPALAPHLVCKVAQIRFWYARKDQAIYLSQLELQAIFERALRRAAVPLAFSQGFHPLPLISFGRALPVGVGSECEWFSVFLRSGCDLNAVQQTMNKGLPAGLAITRLETLSLQKQGADAFEETYTIIAPQENEPAFTQAWEHIEQANTLPWLRETKKGVRSLDARGYFARITPQVNQCTVVVNWEHGYISPLALCTAALEAVGYSTPAEGLQITKVQTGLAAPC